MQDFPGLWEIGFGSKMAKAKYCNIELDRSGFQNMTLQNKGKSSEQTALRKISERVRQIKQATDVVSLSTYVELMRTSMWRNMILYTPENSGRYAFIY